MLNSFYGGVLADCGKGFVCFVFVFPSFRCVCWGKSPDSRNTRLEAAVKHDSIDTASQLSETLVEACKEAGLKARGKSQNKWFDQECETEKENLQSLGEKISKNTNNSELRQLLRDKDKRFKQTCRRKKREYISKGMSNINIQNSKETWRQIRKIFNLGKRKTHRAETVSTEQFYKYFKHRMRPLSIIY